MPVMKRRHRLSVARRLRPDLCCVDGTHYRASVFSDLFVFVSAFSFSFSIFVCFINFIFSLSIFFPLFRITRLLPPKNRKKRRDGGNFVYFLPLLWI